MVFGCKISKCDLQPFKFHLPVHSSTSIECFLIIMYKFVWEEESDDSKDSGPNPYQVIFDNLKEKDTVDYDQRKYANEPLGEANEDIQLSLNQFPDNIIQNLLEWNVLGDRIDEPRLLSETDSKYGLFEAEIKLLNAVCDKLQPFNALESPQSTPPKTPEQATHSRNMLATPINLQSSEPHSCAASPTKTKRSPIVRTSPFSVSPKQPVTPSDQPKYLTGEERLLPSPSRLTKLALDLNKLPFESRFAK